LIGDKQGDYIPGDRSTSHRSIDRNDRPGQFINYYELTRDGQKYRVEVADVIHFRDGIDPFDTRYGISRLTTILREIYGDSAAANYASNLLSGNGVIPFVLGIDDKEGSLSQEDLDNIKSRLESQTSGKNAGKPLVVTSRVTFNRTGLTPAEIDTRQSRMMAQDIFAAVTGIPAVVLNFSSGMDRSIYNNMSEADRRAVQSYLVPLWWHRDQEFTHQLLRDIDSDESHFVESDLSEVAVLQEDENLRWARVGKAYQDGLLKRGEGREAINYEAAEDGSDDVYDVRPGSETVSPEQEQIERDASIERTKNPPELPEGNEPLQIGAGEKEPLRLAK
jgi:HK97 family phage portal protein